jgi:hypothetical protein
MPAARARAINETGPRDARWTCNATIVVVYGKVEDLLKQHAGRTERPAHKEGRTEGTRRRMEEE